MNILNPKQPINTSQTKRLGHSVSIDRLPGNFSVDFANFSSIAMIRGCFNPLQHRGLTRTPTNLFNIESNRKLDFVLRHGYSYKNAEKQQFEALKSSEVVRRAQRDFACANSHNSSMMEMLRTRPKGDRLNQSTQDFYCDLFTERYKKMAENAMNANESAYSIPTKKEDGLLLEERKSDKKNRLYNELGMNLNLKEIFQGLNEEELEKLKIMHGRYASTKTPQFSAVSGNSNQININN